MLDDGWSAFCCVTRYRERMPRSLATAASNGKLMIASGDDKGICWKMSYVCVHAPVRLAFQLLRISIVGVVVRTETGNPKLRLVLNAPTHTKHETSRGKVDSNFDAKVSCIFPGHFCIPSVHTETSYAAIDRHLHCSARSKSKIRNVIEPIQSKVDRSSLRFS